MKNYLFRWLLACAVMVPAWAISAQSGGFSFGVVAHMFKTVPEEGLMRDAISESGADNLAFVVANGIKSGTEPCSDPLYNRRKLLLNEAKNALVLSLAASDWVNCKRENGKSSAMERLSRMRDLFFSDHLSFGQSKILIARQSATPKFREYGENARWNSGNILFASINLPADNNHYLRSAGRNSEFEDRLVANRDWLQRIFTIAKRRNLAAIVLFCDGNPMATEDFTSLSRRYQNRDGFAEIRREITTLSGKFSGKVLIVHAQADSTSDTLNIISWRGNLGEVGTATGWVKFTVNPALPALFSIDRKPAIVKNAVQ
jgi:hypothetical protein